MRIKGTVKNILLILDTLLAFALLILSTCGIWSEEWLLCTITSVLSFTWLMGFGYVNLIAERR